MDYSFLILLGGAFWLYLFTVGSGILADRKHRSVGWWVLFGLIFGPFAFATLLLLAPATDAAGGLSQTQHIPTRECPFCLSAIPVRAQVCRFCARDMPVPASQQPHAPRGPMTAAEWEDSVTHPDDCDCAACAQRHLRAPLQQRTAEDQQRLASLSALDFTPLTPEERKSRSKK